MPQTHWPHSPNGIDLSICLCDLWVHVLTLLPLAFDRGTVGRGPRDMRDRDGQRSLASVTGGFRATYGRATPAVRHPHGKPSNSSKIHSNLHFTLYVNI